MPVTETSSKYLPSCKLEERLGGQQNPEGFLFKTIVLPSKTQENVLPCFPSRSIASPRREKTLVLLGLMPEKKMGGDESCRSCLSFAYSVNDAGIPFTELQCNHGITCAHQGYNISYPACGVCALSLLPYLFPSTAGYAELSPAESQNCFK